MNKLNKVGKYTNLEGWVSIVSNVLLALLKYWAGLVSGSVALIADAWHTISDSLSSVVIIIGGRISLKPADETHPFGHGRMELVSTIAVSVMLFIVAFSFMKESIQKFSNHEQAVYGTVALVVTIVSIIAKEGLAQFAFYCARKSGSLALKADAWHHRTDSISSVLILIGILAGKNFWWMDSILGILVALIIAYTAYSLTSTTISRILGEKPDKQTLKRVIEIANEVSQSETSPHHFHLHDYVMHKELTFHLKLPPDLNISEAHRLVSKIEDKIREELDIIATIHIEPKI
ncbi:MAG: cation diffusion facilitator family transporter [Marinilabiliaceae bacterium]|jgi:cation diffusion facilitator family transporter|nr:cation diffusion facilitator family transporter [Marinilabiliaceae bacterium]